MASTPQQSLGHRLLPWLVVVLALAALSVTAESFRRTVGRVLDGDIVEVLDASKTLHRVRLAGIDTPESGQPFGTQSKRHLLKLVGGKLVTVDWHKLDRYQRIVGKIMIDGRNANLAMVEAGLAWWYREYQREQLAQDRRLYEIAETRARSELDGLWKDPQALAPWDWRNRPAMPEQDAIECPCGSGRVCTGPKDGRFCVRESGSKRYVSKN